MVIPDKVAEARPKIRKYVPEGGGPKTPVLMTWGPSSGINIVPEVAQRSNPALPGVARWRVPGCSAVGAP